MTGTKTSSKIILSIAEIIIGILLLIDPVGFTSGIVIILGFILAIMGIVSIINYFREDPETAIRKGNLATGLILCAVGLFCILRSGWFLTTFPVFTVFYGILMLIGGMCKVQWSVDLLRTKQKYWFWTLLSAVITVVCAIIIISNPFTSTVVLWAFIGITLIAEAIVDIISMIFAKK
ncbi:MAG: DUF308 domain-containing protein [Clostridia bacterium]|nr:DUF308 domain-containing protein [Clostridia bacterium]